MDKPFMEVITGFLSDTGFAQMSWQQGVMLLVSFVLIYLAIKKEYEPLLLLPIAFGMLLANLPLAGLNDAPVGVYGEDDFQPGGLLYYLYMGVKLGIYPPLIFMGVGAMTDFAPLIANPKSLLLGAAAQLGIFAAFILAILLKFPANVAASIGIIGGADGPTAIYVTTKLAPEYLGAIAIAAYSYMALVPIIQPPIMKALTTKEERQIVMEQLRPVSN
jgi:sodium ion-translocating decarboxylase beta subunit